MSEILKQKVSYFWQWMHSCIQIQILLLYAQNMFVFKPLLEDKTLPDFKCLISLHHWLGWLDWYRPQPMQNSSTDTQCYAVEMCSSTDDLQLTSCQSFCCLLFVRVPAVFPSSQLSSPHPWWAADRSLFLTGRQAQARAWDGIIDHVMLYWSQSSG